MPTSFRNGVVRPSQVLLDFQHQEIPRMRPMRRVPCTCRKGPGVDSIHGTDGVCCQEAGAQAEEMMECKDCRVSKRIPSERIANTSMSVGLSGPVCHTAVVCNRNRKS